MMPQTFLVIQPVPQSIYDDKDLLWDVLDAVYRDNLAYDKGERAPGPLYIREMSLGEIEGSSLAEFIESLEFQVAVFRITGPAFPPDIPAMIS